MEISKEAELTANIIAPFLNPKLKDMDLVLIDIAKTIQRTINNFNNANEFSEKEMIEAVRIARRTPHTFLSSDVVKEMKERKH